MFSVQVGTDYIIKVGIRLWNFKKYNDRTGYGWPEETTSGQLPPRTSSSHGEKMASLPADARIKVKRILWQGQYKSRGEFQCLLVKASYTGGSDTGFIYSVYENTVYIDNLPAPPEPADLPKVTRIFTDQELKEGIILDTGRKYKLILPVFILKIKKNPNNSNQQNEKYTLSSTDDEFYNQTFSFSELTVDKGDYIELHFVGVRSDLKYNMEVDPGGTGKKYFALKNESLTEYMERTGLYEMTMLPCDKCYTQPWTFIKRADLQGSIPDAPSLSMKYKGSKKIDADEYRYILPNDVWIDTKYDTGYLLAHIRHKDGDRHIHLFTFDPNDPKKLTHIYCGGDKGAFLSPTNSDEFLKGVEVEGGGGVCEASLNVVKDMVYIHYVSWSNKSGKPVYSFVSEISLGYFKNGETSGLNRKGVVQFFSKDGTPYEKGHNTVINVRHNGYNEKNKKFYAINGRLDLKAGGLKLFSSTDGINFNEKQNLDVSGQDSSGRKYGFDIGAHIEFLGEDKIWFVHYAHTKFEEGKKKEILSHIFELENNGNESEFENNEWTKMPNYATKPPKVLVENKPGSGYSTAIDSPAIYKYKEKWYMFIAGSDTPLEETEELKMKQQKLKELNEKFYKELDEKREEELDGEIRKLEDEIKKLNPNPNPYADSKIYLFSCECR